MVLMVGVPARMLFALSFMDRRFHKKHYQIGIVYGFTIYGGVFVCFSGVFPKLGVIIRIVVALKENLNECNMVYKKVFCDN